MNDVGRFMFGIGALLYDSQADRMLLLKRANTNTFNQDKWELVYGRVAQGEDIQSALQREILEEVGHVAFDIKGVLRFWHFFRGEKKSENEIMGMTFLCLTREVDVTLGEEHSSFLWVKPEEALDLITVDGIRQDVKVLIDRKSSRLTATNLDGSHVVF